MQGREIFGALLRALGIWFLILASSNIVYLGLRLSHAIDSSNSQMTIDKLFAGINLLLAFILIAGADKLARLIYGQPRA